MNLKSTTKLLVLSLCFFTKPFESAAIIATEPTIQTISFSSTPGSCSEIDLSFFPGDGSRRLVVARADNPVNEFPVDGVGYTAGSIFGTGANLTNGNYVVYNASGSSTTITGLDGGTEYFFAIFELNGNGINSNYLLTGYLETHEIAPGVTVSLSSTSGDMCEGDSVKLTAGDADSYHWTPSGSLSSSTGTDVWATPSSTTTYTVEGSDNNSGCTNTKSITITVYSAPNVTLGNYSNKCINGSSVNLTSGSPSGGTYSGTGVSGTKFYPSVAGLGSHMIFYSYSDIHGCSSSDSSSVTVLDKPNVSFSTLTDVCEDGGTVTLSGGSPVGGTYSGTSVTSGQFHPSTAGVGVFSIRYVYTDANSCSDTSYEDQHVRALPNVTFATLQPVCLNLPPFTLTGGTPAGGTYAGNGVVNSQFSPLVTGAGSFTITYAYTDSFGCSAEDTSVLKVNTLPSVSFSSLTPVCQNFGPVTLSGGAPAGGTYSGTAVGGGVFYTGIAGPGQHVITYSYANSNNCTNTATETMTVNAAPDPDLGPDNTICSNEGTVLNGGSFTAYTWSTGAHTQTIYVDSAGHGLGTFTYILLVSNNFGCANRDTVRITWDGCVGIDNPSGQINDGLTVFPNPSGQQFTVVADEGSIISVFDMKGSLILEEKNSKSTFTFGENLPAGSYLICVQKNHSVIRKLILKN